jgi:sRNA-binding regulator protein Hfq
MKGFIVKRMIESNEVNMTILSATGLDIQGVIPVFDNFDSALEYAKFDTTAIIACDIKK